MRTKVVLLFSTLLIVFSAALAAPIQFRNQHILLQLADESDHFQLLNITSIKQGSYSFIVSSDADVRRPLWEAQFVTRDGVETISSDTDCQMSHRTSSDAQNSYLRLSWNGITLPQHSGVINAEMLFTLGNDSPVVLVSWNTSSTISDVGLWQVSLGVHGVGSTSGGHINDTLLYPAGFGVLQEDPAYNFDPITAVYPGPVTMQLCALYNRKYAQGLYFAMHDPAGTVKQLSVVPDMTKYHYPSVAMSFILYPENAGQQLRSWGMPYNMAVGVFQGDWYDATMIYRDWALSSASWVKSGPISKRPDFAKWYLNNNVWVNTGWQPIDIFNETQGDPDVVLERAANIKKRFNTSLALHWYVWDEIPFDVQYPEFFPPKPGFAEAVQKLQAMGVHVVPYINGRIFDIKTKSWEKEHAVDYTCKNAPATFDSQNFTIYEETYGSGATFSVMCPHTEYWQDKIATIVGELARTYEVEGVYIDQIAAAGGERCFDPTHKHPVGGGDYWTEGYRKMLQLAHHGGLQAQLITESNAESFMDTVNGYLTIMAYMVDFAGDTRLVPAFPAIYGGYYISLGSMFVLSDLAQPDLFTSRLGKMFVYGTQLGWFSLGGTSDIPPMGMYDALMSDQYTPEVDYLRTLCAYRTLANSYLVHGRLVRPIELKVSADVIRTDIPLRTHPDIPRSRRDGTVSYEPVMSAVWQSDSKSLAVLLTAVTTDDMNVDGELDMTLYGFPDTSAKFQLNRVTPVGRTKVGVYQGKVPLSAAMSGRSVWFFEITPV